MTTKRVLIVGAGLTGATIARTLTDAGLSVFVVEKRDRVGGNCADYLHESGCYVGLHGPHYFRSSNERIWQWANRFADFYPYEAKVVSWVDGRYEAWPVQWEYVQRIVDSADTNPTDYLPERLERAINFTEACLCKMPMRVYSKVVGPYTEKQWGCDPRELDAALAARVEVRADGDTRLKKCKWQGIPRGGYSAWIGRMLEGIQVRTRYDWLYGYGNPELALRLRLVVGDFPQIVYTGPIDALFGYDLGRLKYRGQRRTHTFSKLVGYGARFPVGQVNYPDIANQYIREIEWKHMAEDPSKVYGSLVTAEEPFSPDDPDQQEYPFPSAAQRDLADQYRKRAEAIPGLVLAGRLATFKYYDMDQSIAHGLCVAEHILKGT